MDHTIRLAPFRLGLNPDGSLQETSGRFFDLQAYSRMKYGVRTDVQYFAKELVAELRLKAPQLFTGVQPPALLTAYKAAAPPATTLARYCLDIINLARFQVHVAPGELVQVYRPQDYIEEYAILPAEERKRLMGSHTSNSLRGRSLAGFMPVILDDIYVTGTYTAMMRQVLLIEQDNFVFTRRFLKMLLRTPADELQAVARQLPALLLEEIRHTDATLQHLFPEACALLMAASSSQ